MLNSDVAAFNKNCKAANGTARENNKNIINYGVLVSNCE
jgi:hypothetical protein